MAAVDRWLRAHGLDHCGMEMEIAIRCASHDRVRASGCVSCDMEKASDSSRDSCTLKKSAKGQDRKA